MLIPFDTKGNIRPGIHYYTYDLFKKQFVDNIVSSTRKGIHHLSFLWLAALERVVTPIEVWFDGDFISSSKDPQAIDLCVFLLKTSLNSERVVDNCLKLSSISYEQYKCHAYFGIIQETESKVEPLGPYYWTEQFGFDLLNTPKGIVVLPWEEISTALK